MANRLLRSPLARLDLIDIWQFIADDNERAADGLLDKIEVALTMLRDNPLAGRARPELATALRSFPVGNYVLFYRPLPDGVELVRALNGRQDVQPENID
ncbi:plasmid stabilization protein [Rhodoblastus sphagnicola]|uniref:Plasmid stabilization protein n=1 Tax=Rhodoblastus sphagnicola TaxID=333368 RepID=A0A2S6NEY3_9HYPH|nr:type II toxin-antitoxin system RelE/ParE family toxin [Rhodoblastus sphagnicola]PPQ33205.1 plasmid stabilization protein [Rhodoblastus sphagnicola]